ncbi:MAG: ABC transporter substrate-binding protein, partial [Ilumatobacteraceae bacterium]
MLATAGLVVSACGGSDDSEPAAEPAADSASEPASEPAEEPAEDDTLGETETDVTLPPDDDADSIFGGTLRYGLEADVNGLNPTSSALAASGLMMANAVYDTLAVYDENDVSTPHLAESFTPNDTLTTWTMKLREGITFHDGTPLNAEAVLVNFNAQRGDPLVGLAIMPFFPA